VTVECILTIKHYRATWSICFKSTNPTGGSYMGNVNILTIPYSMYNFKSGKISVASWPLSVSHTGLAWKVLSLELTIVCIISYTENPKKSKIGKQAKSSTGKSIKRLKLIFKRKQWIQLSVYLQRAANGKFLWFYAKLAKGRQAGTQRFCSNSGTAGSQHIGGQKALIGHTV
jgi:Na+/melibiose symporter-like transporter